MSYSTYLALALATLPHGTPRDDAEPTPDLGEALTPALDGIRQLVEAFRSNPVTPAAAARFEGDLQQRLRALGRAAAGWAYNALEPAAVPALPGRVHCEGSTYRRLAH